MSPSLYVKDTHYPLYLFPFPGVSVCPTDKIKRHVAFSYIYEKLNLTTGKVNNDSIDQFLSAMTMMQHPMYSRMSEFLANCQDLLPHLSKLNLTDFMLKVMPTCDEVFSACAWHGMTENCCDIFHIQRSEEGFCYSFNSFTSHRLSNCPQLTYDEQVSFKDVEAEVDTECVLRRNSAAGTTTGIEVFLRHFDTSQLLINWSTITGESGVKVQLHTSDEYPEAGMGVLVPAKPGMKMTTTIKAYLTESLPAIRGLPLGERNCYFPDETELEVAVQYSQRSCLIECRLHYFHQICGCRPYYFNMLDNRIPICNATQLLCIANHGSNLKFYRPPNNTNMRGFAATETVSPLNCSRCLPTCHESYYDDDTDLTTDTQQRALENYGYLDLYYKYGGAVYYQRDVTFGWIDLLVGIGGTAGLFLGISLLSVVELLFWSVKLILTGFVKKKIPAVPTSLPKGLVYNKDFLY
ncbi:sodium channel protein Nach-like [Macrosteles quadrilineatus]|uniref:sodium channel protein Nach-like n=1 Tax=Macrosteles quadrilineatus TaxID=74068 RepID=UPI0023E16C83|nr:sodium channel protein Nach-like [Macrosteles quadrilineatus]